MLFRSIPVLTEYFLRKYSAEYSRPYSEVSPETMHLFMDYAWPGNIRELQNLVRRIVVLGTESPVRKEIGLCFPVAARRATSLSSASPSGDAAAVDCLAVRRTHGRCAGRVIHQRWGVGA